MIKHSSRQVIFFVLIFLIFFLSVKLGQFWVLNSNVLKSDLIFIIVAVGYTLTILFIYYLAKLNKSSETFWDISPAARCKGGPYMWQGDSQNAKLCREMAESPEGRAMISSYNCPTGQIGVPKVPFEYSVLSNDNWEDERIIKVDPYKLQDPGPTMQSDTAQIQN
jgi:hypothetical protein